MKKIILIFFIFIFKFNSSYAIEEIYLPEEVQKLDYFSDIYYGKIEDANPVFKLFSQKGLEFENSYINSIKASFLYEGQLQFLNSRNEGLSSKHDFVTVEPMIKAKFNENKTEAMFDINLVRDLKGYSNELTEKISAVYIMHNINENQRILFGQGSRTPATYNGSLGTMQQEFILKSQLGRTLGDSRAFGIRNLAKYKYLEYDIGLYDSTRYMKDFGHGLDFTGHIVVKPFGDYNEKFGKLRLGTSYNIGEYRNAYSQYAFFIGYDINKFHFRTEYANANGYNAVQYSRNDTDGFYTTIAYDITNKFTIITRYDCFNPNKDLSNDTTREYTAGITYNLFKNMKIMMNFVKRDFSDKNDSNMILFATRFII